MRLTSFVTQLTSALFRTKWRHCSRVCFMYSWVGLRLRNTLDVVRACVQVSRFLRSFRSTTCGRSFGAQWLSMGKSVRGDVVDFPASRDEHAFQAEFFGDEIRSGSWDWSFDRPSSGDVDHFWAILRPLTLCDHDDHMKPLPRFKELEEQLKVFEKGRKLLEAQRLKQYWVRYWNVTEMGYTNGVETTPSYGWPSGGEPPYNSSWLLFPEDFIMIDESHMTMGQIRHVHWRPLT